MHTAKTLVTLWITAATMAGQDELLHKIVSAIGDVETGSIKDHHKRVHARRGNACGWYQITEDLWYDATIYRFKQGKRLYLYREVFDPFCARSYCYSALEMLCERWFNIFGCYPTIRELANCYREGLAAVVRGRIRSGNYGQRVENLVMKD